MLGRWSATDAPAGGGAERTRRSFPLWPPQGALQPDQQKGAPDLGRNQRPRREAGTRTVSTMPAWPGGFRGAPGGHQLSRPARAHKGQTESTTLLIFNPPPPIHSPGHRAVNPAPHKEKSPKLAAFPRSAGASLPFHTPHRRSHRDWPLPGRGGQAQNNQLRPAAGEQRGVVARHGRNASRDGKGFYASHPTPAEGPDCWPQSPTLTDAFDLGAIPTDILYTAGH